MLRCAYRGVRYGPRRVFGLETGRGSSTGGGRIPPKELVMVVAINVLPKSGTFLLAREVLNSAFTMPAGQSGASNKQCAVLP